MKKQILILVLLLVSVFAFAEKGDENNPIRPESGERKIVYNTTDKAYWIGVSSSTEDTLSSSIMQLMVKEFRYLDLGVIWSTESRVVIAYEGTFWMNIQVFIGDVRIDLEECSISSFEKDWKEFSITGILIVFLVLIFTAFIWAKHIKKNLGLYLVLYTIFLILIVNSFESFWICLIVGLVLGSINAGLSIWFKRYWDRKKKEKEELKRYKKS